MSPRMSYQNRYDHLAAVREMFEESLIVALRYRARLEPKVVEFVASVHGVVPADLAAEWTAANARVEELTKDRLRIHNEIGALIGAPQKAK